MGELEEKLSSVMNDPQMLEKLKSIAQSMGAEQPPPAGDANAAAFPEMDMAMLQKLSGFASQSGIDKDQQALLHALAPYISQRRVSRLERAMRAAKMAGLATNLLGR